MPISMLGKTTTIYLATPGSETCWLSRAMKQPHPDNPALPLLPTLRAYQPCVICAQKNKAQVCPHVINMRSKIKNTRRENALRVLISDKQTFVAEVYGLHADRNRKCFSSEAIEQMRTKPRTVIAERPRFIIICVDTAEGGSDEFAIVAYTMGANGTWVVRKLFLVFLGGVKEKERACFFILPRPSRPRSRRRCRSSRPLQRPPPPLPTSCVPFAR
jgi:hypothetical protein